MAIDWKVVVSDLETGLSFVQKIAPAASIGGPVAASIGSVVSSVAGLAQGYLTAATATEAVIESTDLAQVQDLTAKLIAANDVLAIQIAIS